MLPLVPRAILSALPIIVALTLLIRFQFPASRSMPPSYFITVLLVSIFWQLPFSWVFAATLNGILTALSILLIVFGALLLLNTLKISGSLSTIGAFIYSLTPDRRIQALILAFGFATLIEGASGFGTAGALTAPLLVGIGFPPLAAAMITLMGHAPAVSFGAVGTPILGGIAAVLDTPEVHEELTVPFLEWITGDVAVWNANFHLFGALIIPPIIILYLTTYFGREKEVKRGLEVWPIALLAGFSFTLTQNITARVTGPELPSMMGGIMVLILLGFLTQKKLLTPADPWDFPPEKDWHEEWRGAVKTDPPVMKMSVLWAFMPYLLIFLLLFLTRIEDLGMKRYFFSPQLYWPALFGTELHFSWRWLYNPGIFPFLPVTFMAWFYYRLSPQQVLRISLGTLKQILPATVAMVFAVAMAQIMMHSGNNPLQLEGMLPSLATASLHLFSGAFPLISPWIGVLGSFLSGSNTVSNILFSGYQYEVAGNLNLSRTIMVALQSTGAAVGNIITIHNVVAVLTVVGALGREGLVVKRNLLPLVFYLSLVGLMGLFAFYFYPGIF